MRSRVRPAGLLVVLAAVLAPLAAWPSQAGAPARATAASVVRPPGTPVADNDALYTACGRVFPDPQAFGPSPAAAPGESPYAKGNSVCRAVDFIQYDEAISGLRYLEKKFPRFVKVFNLKTDFASVIDTSRGDGQSAGLPNSLLGRDKADLYMVRITDGEVPNADKKNFLFTLSLHGIEKAGLEGGLRAAEDLATWGATKPDQRIMETQSDSLPAGEVLKKSVVWFAMNNPDGWRRGDTSKGGISYQRYNGNGVDLNRDWPDVGFTFRPYTPASEPETATFMKVLKSISPRWAGGVDLHGQLIDRAFSFTLLGASQRRFDKNQRMLQFTRGAYQDAEKRLAWSPLIKPNDAPIGCTDDPGPGCDPRLYGVQFGSIWDTIAYTVTGAIGNWGDSELGLGADFIDNEMSLSHLSNCGTGKCYLQQAEQLHVDGNKALIYAMLNYTLLPEDTRFQTVGRTAYITTGKRIASAGHGPKPVPALPVQDPLNTTLVKTPTADATYEFDVLPASAGKANNGLKAKATFSNVQGVGPGALLGLAVDKQNTQEPEPGGSPWTTVNQDFNQSPVYLQSGMQVDANDLTPGHYRVRIFGEGAAAVDVNVTFTAGRAWPDPGQRPYDVSNVDFFRDLVPFAPTSSLVPVTVADLAAGKVDLRQFDTVIGADKSIADTRIPAVLKAFAKAGGNVVLTDDAISALAPMGIVAADDIVEKPVYAGSVAFLENPESGDPYAAPLARDVHEPGAAEGPNHRKQTSEPVPTGWSIQDKNGNDANSLPQHGVKATAWTAAGGKAVGTIGDATGGDVTFGEIPLGLGQVRILGSVLPMPTTQFDHPFGLSSYSVTPAAYVMVRNLISYLAPDRAYPAGYKPGVYGPAPGTVQNPPETPEEPTQQPPKEQPGLPTTGGLPLAVLAMLLLATGVAVRWSRRTSAV